MSELQDICESSQFVSELLCVYSYICCSEERSHIFHQIQEVLNRIVQNHKTEQLLPIVEDLVKSGNHVTTCTYMVIYFFPEA